MITGMSAESTSRPVSEPTAPESGHAPEPPAEGPGAAHPAEGPGAAHPAEGPGAAHPGDDVLEPTAILPGPVRAESEAPGEAATRVITGKVLAGGRHRGSRHRNSARVVGTAGTAVLSATGAFAGLTLLAGHADRGDRHATAASVPRQTAAPAPRSGAQHPARPAQPAQPARPAEPSASAVPSGVQDASFELAAGSAPATAVHPADDLTTHTDAAPTRARHARPTGPWRTSDWEEALRRMLPNGRPFPGPTGFGRHHFH
jgi:hypothetical protein